MKTRTKLISLILSLCLILPCMILFSACDNNDKTLNYIAVSLNDGEFEPDIFETRDYGNTENLDNFKIKAYYSNNSQEEIDLS